MKTFTKMFMTLALLCMAGVANAQEDPVKEAPDGWTNAITNGNLASEDVSSFVSKEYPSPDILATTITVDATNGSRCIVVKGADETEVSGAQDWDTQFWIVLPEALQEGTMLHVEFDYKASHNATGGTQAHCGPGDYNYWQCVGNVEFTTEWKTFSKDIEISAFMAHGDSNGQPGTKEGMRSIAFNLAVDRTATEYYFDNFGVWYKEPKVIDSWTNIVYNSDMEGTDDRCFWSKNAGEDQKQGIIEDGIGYDGTRGIRIQTADREDTGEKDNNGNAIWTGTDWDAQFFVRLAQPVTAGTKYRVSFNYKASVVAGGDRIDSQAHCEPGDYNHWACIGSPSWTSTDWQTYTAEGSISGDMSKDEKLMKTIAFNLSCNHAATEFVFDNFVFEIPTEAVTESDLPSGGDEPEPDPIVIPEIPEGYEDLAAIPFMTNGEEVQVENNLSNETVQKTIGAGGVVIGTSTVAAETFADYSAYGELMIICAKPDGSSPEGISYRVLMNRQPQEDGQGPLVERAAVADANGYAKVDVSDLNEVHVNAIKVGWGQPDNLVFYVVGKKKAPVPPVEPTYPEGTIVYNFELAAFYGENPANKNGSAANGQAFYGWENAEKTDSKRQDYKGYEWAEGSVLPEACHVWRRSDRINGNMTEGGLKCPNNKEMAIDGLYEGAKVVIVYDATAAAEDSKEIIWAIGDGTSEGGPGVARATATINGADAVTGQTTIPSGAEIVVNSVTPADNVTDYTGYIVFQVKKGMIINHIAIVSTGTPTGISTVTTTSAEDNVIYDLQGRRVQNAQKGLYIVNGKKVIK